jgi:hypothetical protein
MNALLLKGNVASRLQLEGTFGKLWTFLNQTCDLMMVKLSEWVRHAPGLDLGQNGIELSAGLS